MRQLLTCIVAVLIALVSVQAQEWHTNFDTAKELAEHQNKPIVLVFQGSDWCAPCIKLDKEIWSTEEFKTQAEKKFILLKADFPRRKKNTLSEVQKVQNAKLADKYNKRGMFPLVVVLTAKGELLGATGYKQISPIEYVSLLTSFVTKS